MRTASTKQLEVMSFEKLSSWSIVIGAAKELYRRYDVEVWAFAFWMVIAINIWQKLG